jgi:hypothetical protein
MQRRHLLLAGGALALGGCSAAEVKTFPTIGTAIDAVRAVGDHHRTTGAWSLAQVLDHAAQSVEFSLRGFPQMRSALFRATAGGAAFAWFDARGAMSHGLAEPIPGAPALGNELPAAAARLVKALRAFEAHEGAFAPHFAYGALTKDEYTRAHLMHLANHWSEVVAA